MGIDKTRDVCGFALLALGLTAAAAGCFEAADRSDPDALSGGGGASGAAGAVGIPPGGSGGFVVGGAGGAAGAGPVPCGFVQCEVSDIAGLVESCCSPSNECSFRMPGAPCLDPVPPDPRCGTFDVMGLALPGCCLPGGECGINAEMLGVGCTSVDVLGGFLPMGELPRRRCDVLDAGIDDDAGDDDAGTPP